MTRFPTLGLRPGMLWPLAMLAACNGPSDTDSGTPGDDDDTVTTNGDDDDDDVTGDDDDDTAPAFGAVMRNCPTDIGNICPYAGAGYNGFNGDAVDRLDAWFNYPMSVAFPPAGVSGRPLIEDWNNHKIRAINDDPAAGFETIMGTDFLGDGDALLQDRVCPGVPGNTIALNHPTQGVYLSNGNFLADNWHTHKFREWDPTTGLACVKLGSRGGYALDVGGGELATANLIDDDGDGKVDEVGEFDQPGRTTLMNQPKELAVDPNDENIVYYVDMRNERIRRWNRTTDIVDTIAGETVDSSDTDTTVGSKGYVGEGIATQVTFSFPKNGNPEPGGAIAVMPSGTAIYVADSENQVIRRINLTDGTTTLISGSPGVAGFADGPALTALWSYPSDFAYDENTNELFVADTNNHRVRVINLDTMQVSTVAGTGEPTCPVADLLVPATCANQHDGGDGHPAVDATLYRPFGVDLDQDGNLIISDTYDNRIRIVYR